MTAGPIDVDGRWRGRLADELLDDGIELPLSPVTRDLLLEELDHCRRTPVFEGRRPTYGAVILPDRPPDSRPAALDEHIEFDIVPLDGDLDAARNYADGRSSYLVRSQSGGFALACFERAMVFEADLVAVQELTGSIIVQRSPVLDVVRMFVDGSVVSWNGRNWQGRPTATTMRPALLDSSPELGPALGGRLLALAVHWLAPARIGATIVIAHDRIDPIALDLSTAAPTPALSFGNRRHFSAIAAVLARHDLAVIADATGAIDQVAVGLRWSEEAHVAVDSGQGMRHRSAQRFSHDRPEVTVIVVSEDGPVTIYRRGETVVTTRGVSG